MAIYNLFKRGLRTNLVSLNLLLANKALKTAIQRLDSLAQFTSSFFSRVDVDNLVESIILMLERNRLCACKQSPSGVWAVKLGENNNQWEIPDGRLHAGNFSCLSGSSFWSKWKKYLPRVLWMLLCDSVFFPCLEIEKLWPYQPGMLELHYRYLGEQTFISVGSLIRLPPHTHSDWVPSG